MNAQDTPPLPEPWADTLYGWAYTADQMHARDAMWAQKVEQAVAEERERCAKVCDSLGTADHEYARYFYEGTEKCAAAIRSRA